MPGGLATVGAAYCREGCAPQWRGYYYRLSPALQEEIIARTEHTAF
jgi:hypothetical protein